MNPVKLINDLLQKSCSVGSDESSWKIHLRKCIGKKASSREVLNKIM